MRRSVLVAALLGTTALVWPERAEAGPVVAFVSGAIGVSASSAIATGAFAGAFSAGLTFGGTAFGAFAVRTVISLGLSALAAALTPKPQAPPPSATLVNFAQPISYAERVYGQTRKGGPIGFTGFANSRRYVVPIIAAHSIDGVVEHWLDERPVALTAEADTNLSNVGTAPIAGYGRIDPFLGQPGQVVNAGLDGAFTEITAAHDFKGLSGAVVWAQRPPQSAFSEIYPNGREWSWTPVIRGLDQIYDPRDASTGYSNNAALVLADWFVNVLGQQVDWDDVAIEANHADTLVTTKELTTRPKWTINGWIRDDEDFEAQRAKLAVAADAFVYERSDGKVGFTLGRYIEPTVTLTTNDFWAITLQEGGFGAGEPTSVAVKYTEPENAWRETPSGAFVVEAGAREVRDEPELFTVTNHNQASWVNKRLARTKRAKYRLEGTIGAMGYELIGQRFFRVQHLGIDQVFEVGRLERIGVAQFAIQANSVTADDFTLDAATEEPTRPTFGSPSSSDDIPVVTGLAVSADAGGVLTATWDAQNAAYTQQVRFRVVGSSDWNVVTVADGESRQILVGTVDGQNYEVQARNRTAALRAGAWGPDPAIESSAVQDPNAPGDITVFSTSLGGDEVTLSWTTPNSMNFAGTRIYRGPTTTFGDASLIATVYGAANTAANYVDGGLSDGTYNYWVVPINGSSIEGNPTGPETETVVLGP